MPAPFVIMTSWISTNSSVSRSPRRRGDARDLILPDDDVARRMKLTSNARQLLDLPDDLGEHDVIVGRRVDRHHCVAVIADGAI